MASMKDLGIINDMPYEWIRASTHNRKIYDLWKNMWMRVSNIKYLEKYPSYKECSICSDWKYLSKFVEWIITQETYNSFKSNPKAGWCLDKDIKVKGNKIYSPLYCSLTTISINSRESCIRNALYKHNQGDTHIMKRPDIARKNAIAHMKPIIGVSIKDNLILLFKSTKEAKEKGFIPSNITKCLKGRQAYHKGYKWFYLDMNDRGDNNE